MTRPPLALINMRSTNPRTLAVLVPQRPNAHSGLTCVADEVSMYLAPIDVAKSQASTYEIAFSPFV